MNKIILQFVVGFLCLNASIAQENYAASSINQELKKGQDAVIRIDEGTYEFEKLDKATFKVKRVVTILNAKGKSEAKFIIGYSDDRKIKDLNAVLYDRNGKVLAKYKEKDFQDYSAINDFSLYEDSRVKYLNLQQKSYPYTVEFSYEWEAKATLHIPDWYVMNRHEISVERSNFKLIFPSATPIRYKQLNTSQQPIIVEDGDSKSVSWSFKNVVGLEREPFSRGVLDFTPIIRTGPTKFELGGISGDASTWDGFALWQTALNNGLEALPDNVKVDVLDLIRPLTSQKEKVEAIYNYMQNSTRYISIQLGIGGFRPFSPAYVAKNGYGDCKALSYYTKALLEVAGIESYYAWISAGSNFKKADPAFPNDNFNHVILCVPTVEDTVWLECTSQRMPAGYLGSFTADRYALVMDDHSANLIKTPVYKDSLNEMLIKAAISLDKNNEASIDLEMEMVGLASETGGLDYFIFRNQNEQEDWMKDFIDLPDFTLSGINMSQNDGLIPSINVNGILAARGFSTTVSDRLIVNLASLKPMGFSMKKHHKRRSPVNLRSASSRTIATTFNIPEGYTLEKLPDNTNMTSIFGHYSIKYERSEGKIECVRILKYNNGEFEPERYNEFVDFINGVKRSESQRLIFKKLG